MVSKFYLSSLITLMSMSLTGCGSYIMDDIAKKYRFNPNPKEHYQIMVTTSDAPGSFEQAKGIVSYEAANCPVEFHRTGVGYAKEYPQYEKTFEVKKINATTYVGSVYLDALINEDYVGSGVCKWEAKNVYIKLRATSSKISTNFSPYISINEVLQGRSSKIYYKKRLYPDSPNSHPADSGPIGLTSINPNVRNDWFSITLTPQKSY